MMKKLAQAVSYIFHPLLFPTYGAAVVLLVNPHMYGYFGQKLHIVWLIIVFALTFVFPAIWLIMMKRLEMIDSMELHTSRERIIPFIATITFYLWTTWMFKPGGNLKIPANELIFLMMAGASIAGFIGFFINVFTKVSIHTMSAGNMLGLALPLIRYSTYDLRLLLVLVILIAGAVGTARLILQVHTTRQVLLGYLIGFTAQFLAFTFVPKLVHFL